MGRNRLDGSSQSTHGLEPASRGRRFGLRDDEHFRIQAEHNRLAIVGGTGKFRNAGGDATLQAVGDQGSIQRVHLTILR